MNWFNRLLAPFRRDRFEAEMAEEMRLHLEHRTQENVEAGMSPTDARHAALRRFGGVDQAKEVARAQRWGAWVDHLRRDTQFALRGLARSPGFTAVAILSLGLGIGAGTAIFSILNGVLLRSLPVRAPQELRLVNWMGSDVVLNNYSGMEPIGKRGRLEVGSSFPYPVFREMRERLADSAQVFGLFPIPRVTTFARGDASVSSVLMVSGNFFADYGASMLLGRPLLMEDERPGAAPAVVITHSFWERRFGQDPSAIGQTLTLNQSAFTIVGVLPRDYIGPMPGDMADAYITFAAQPLILANRPIASANNWWMQIMVRVGPGTDEQQLRARMEAVFRQLLSGSTTKMGEPGIALEDGSKGAAHRLRQRMAMPLFALLGVVALVMAIACANVAGLLLARGAARQQEFAIRAAIGAGRARLIAQALTESLVLGLSSAVVGLLLAAWGKKVLLRSVVAQLEGFRIDVHTDFRVLVFTLGLALLTALLFGLVPALRAGNVAPLDGLKSRSALAAPRLRLGRMLVSVQIGLSLLLVFGAGLLIRTFSNLVRVDLGFRPENILLFRVAPSQAGMSGPELQPFYDNARRAIAGIPGVRSVALSDVALISGASSSTEIVLPGRPAKRGGARETYQLQVSDGFFKTMGIPILLGREIAETDAAGSLPVVVVNERFAREYFPGEDPVGRTFSLAGSPARPITIVGVCRDTKYDSLREEVPRLMCFSSRQQEQRAMHFVVRTALPPMSLVPAVRKEIATLRPGLPLSNVRTQEHLVRESTLVDRLFAGLCSGLAALALLLACVGLYGLMAYNVARRTGEIGVRMALGATRREIAWPVLREALWLALAGMAVGLPAALGLARLIRNQLYGVSASDPLTLVAGAALLVGIVCAAAWFPARRASRVDPLIALRSE
ncbi:hypothetical protein DB347_23170 [Opitutaceae bacterium EW11]|nr:hypothetical protein DB347_23170 [Opitutaceae bacterium EW11]